jgi:hypothetical protein
MIGRITVPPQSILPQIVVAPLICNGCKGKSQCGSVLRTKAAETLAIAQNRLRIAACLHGGRKPRGGDFAARLKNLAATSAACDERPFCCWLGRFCSLPRNFRDGPSLALD